MKGMSDTMIKILGVATATLVCAAIGGVGGIIMSYIIATSKTQYPFNYGLAFVFGIVFGGCGFVSSIRQLWL
jgi:hypothetical protein